MAYPKPVQRGSVQEGGEVVSAEPSSPVPTGGGPGTIVSIIDDPEFVGDSPAVGSEASPMVSPRVWRGYGIGCATEVLGFIVSLVGANGPEADEIRVFGLELINNALSAGKASFIKHECLMEILQIDLFQAMHKAARSSNLAALAGSCSVSLSLYVHLGKRMLLQLEAFIETVLLRIAEGKSSTYEQQEAALEGILDLCHQARFIRDSYANLDCRIERSNVFEDICALLSKTAFPVNCPLRSVHLISLEGLLAVLNTLSSMIGPGAGEEDVVMEAGQYYADLWSALVEGREPRPEGSTSSTPDDVTAWVKAVRSEKYLKGRLNIAADHFNRDPKKGFHFLQTYKLLPDPLEAKAVACFLRACPGLHKKIIGTLLGEVHLKSKDKDNFYLEVLQQFTDTFDFTGMKFDGALRLFLESFQLPGEAQKIDRIVNCFGTRYYQQNTTVLRSADATYVLAYSVIMLNTDAHNDQVKQKMTLEQFKRNNRGINDGESLPDDFQEELYNSIVSNAIKLQDSGPGGAGVMSAARWADLRRASLLPRGQLTRRGKGVEAFDRDMFCLIWGPTVAAVSVVLDHADDAAIVRQALDGLTLAARVAAHHNVDEVMDSLVVSLCKFTTMLNPAVPKPTVAFGEDFKSRQAAETVFMLANRYGDCLRAGWRNVLDCVVRVHKLGLLPPAVFLMEGEDEQTSMKRIPSAQLRPAKGNASNMLGIKWGSFSFNHIISFDDSSSSSTPTQREGEAEQATLKCIEACRIEEIFSDSKFLRAESLTELVRSIIWASGTGPGGHKSHMQMDQYDTDTAELCLELLIGITIRNRDRIELLWPYVHAHLETVIKQGSHPASPLVERAVLGLLRVCQRLLPYKEDIADELLRSLHLIFKLDPKVAEDLAVVITGEVLGLVKSSAAYIKSEWGWKTVCALLKAASHHPAAFPMAFEALVVVAQDGHLMMANFLPVLETAVSFIDSTNKQETPERATQVLDLLESMNVWLVSCAEGPCDAKDKDTYSSMWLMLIQALCKQVCVEGDPNLRNHAVVLLHRVVSPELHEGLGLPASTWGAVFQDVLLPLVSELAALLQSNSRDHAELDRTLRLAVNMLSKSLLQSLPVLRSLPAFPEIWVATLTALQDCTKNHSEELAEAVPENLKNMLRCMSHQQVLTPSWADASGASLWELTWKKSQSISTGLTPHVLEGTAA